MKKGKSSAKAGQRRQSQSLVLRALKSIVTLRGSSEAIALGTAIGVFVAFTPTIGFQMILAVSIATALGANRPAATIPPWITNPLTIPPIFAFTYWIGTFVWSGPAPTAVYDRLTSVAKGLTTLSLFDIRLRLKEVLILGSEIYMPMLIGGVIVGAITGIIVYLVTLRAIRVFRRHRSARREKSSRRKKNRRCNQRVHVIGKNQTNIPANEEGDSGSRA